MYKSQENEYNSLLVYSSEQTSNIIFALFFLKRSHPVDRAVPCIGGLRFHPIFGSFN